MALPVKMCQQDVVKLDLQAKAAIQDIREFDGPLEALSDLNLKARGKINGLREKIEELEKLALEQDKESDKQHILNNVEKHRTQLASTQNALRKAYLASQITLEKKEKEQLMQGGAEMRQRKHLGRQGLVKASSNVTESLMSLSRLMATQVQHSEQTMATLETSSRTITDTHEEFKNMGGHITASRKLLTKYNRREMTDKLLIFLALVFFFATVLYIVKRRIFSAGVDTPIHTEVPSVNQAA
ncbi:vesicle transport protein SEC20-like [Lingula anatina]|uniref:Vesicle transport protein SEC20-like n=1 Tax=Lingula anatina TaxID=7574 RepID=A0A1S3IDF5_LINAN|nr:vesicle transport protein SEC20-like [Lingula anatina]|eukprot:XP_013395891.1 vesicle transport protein SEC20-like [Lingula anatina]